MGHSGVPGPTPGKSIPIISFLGYGLEFYLGCFHMCESSFPIPPDKGIPLGQGGGKRISNSTNAGQIR